MQFPWNNKPAALPLQAANVSASTRNGGWVLSLLAIHLWIMNGSSWLPSWKFKWGPSAGLLATWRGVQHRAPSRGPLLARVPPWEYRQAVSPWCVSDPIHQASHPLETALLSFLCSAVSSSLFKKKWFLAALGLHRLSLAGAALCCGLWASRYGGLSCCRAGALGTGALVVGARRLSGCGALA